MDRLSPFRVWNPYHRALADGSVGGHSIFDLDREHIFASRHDHVLDSVDDRDETIAVDSCGVAGMEPSIPYRGFGRLFIAPISAHHVETANHDLTLLVGPDLPPLGVDDPDVRTINRDARRFALVCGALSEMCPPREISQDPARFRLAVTLDELPGRQLL